MEPCPLNRFYSPAQRARYRAALPGRFSCRQYGGAPDAGQLAALNYAAARVCLPGTRIEICDCPEKLFVPLPVVGGIRGAEKCAYVFAREDACLPLTLAGASGEAFVLEAAALGLGTCWVTGSYRRALVNADAQPGERLAAVIALGPLAQEAPARKRKPLAQLCLTDPAAWPAWAYKAADAVRQAPSAVNLQPWRLSYSQRTLRLLGRRANSVDMGIAMLHMEAAVGDLPHAWSWGEDKCVAHLIVEADA